MSIINRKHFLKRKEFRSGIGLRSSCMLNYQPNALPLGQNGSPTELNYALPCVLRTSLRRPSVLISSSVGGQTKMLNHYGRHNYRLPCSTHNVDEIAIVTRTYCVHLSLSVRNCVHLSLSVRNCVHLSLSVRNCVHLYQLETACIFLCQLETACIFLYQL